MPSPDHNEIMSEVLDLALKVIHGPGSPMARVNDTEATIEDCDQLTLYATTLRLQGVLSEETAVNLFDHAARRRAVLSRDEGVARGPWK